MWGLLALTAAIFFRAQSLRFREPPQARSKCSLDIFIPLHLETDIQHRVHSRRDGPTPLTLHLALQLAQESCVYDTVARNVCRSTRGCVDLV